MSDVCAEQKNTGSDTENSANCVKNNAFNIQLLCAIFKSIHCHSLFNRFYFTEPNGLSEKTTFPKSLSSVTTPISDNRLSMATSRLSPKTK